MDGPIPILILELGLDNEKPETPLQNGPRAICCAADSLATLNPKNSTVGFHALPPLDSSLIKLTQKTNTTASATTTAKRFFATLNKHTE